jgi:hypothetical protein
MPVCFDGNDTSPPADECKSQRARTGAEINHEFVWLDGERVDETIDHAAISEEVLTEGSTVLVSLGTTLLRTTRLRTTLLRTTRRGHGSSSLSTSNQPPSSSVGGTLSFEMRVVGRVSPVERAGAARLNSWMTFMSVTSP